MRSLRLLLRIRHIPSGTGRVSVRLVMRHVLVAKLLLLLLVLVLLLHVGTPLLLLLVMLKWLLLLLLRRRSIRLSCGGWHMALVILMLRHRIWLLLELMLLVLRMVVRWLILVHMLVFQRVKRLRCRLRHRPVGSRLGRRGKQVGAAEANVGRRGSAAERLGRLGHCGPKMQNEKNGGPKQCELRYTN